MSQENMALVRRWFDEVWNLRRADVVDELITPESVCVADGIAITGPDEFKQQQHIPFLNAFPDLYVSVDSMIADGDQVVVRWSASGVHSGDGLGFQPTHEPVSFHGMVWIQVRDGKLMNAWQNSNIPDVIKGLSMRATA